MKSVVIICIVAVSVLCAVLAVSCGNRQKKSETSGTGAESPFTVEDLRSKRQGMMRAEGTGKSSSVEMATQIARMNALTVLAGKLSPADTTDYESQDGSKVQRTTVQTPVPEATLVDRRVFHDKKTGVFTVWVLIEASMDNN